MMAGVDGTYALSQIRGLRDFVVRTTCYDDNARNRILQFIDRRWPGVRP